MSSNIQVHSLFCYPEIVSQGFMCYYIVREVFAAILCHRKLCCNVVVVNKNCEAILAGADVFVYNG
ncbi:MAG: hypothetical protein HFH70_07660 [Lachnospiraceae bacterium]|nr:hypothetical protein [Lachnospiraceae bacterium]